MNTNFCKLVTNIIYEGYDKFWSIGRISAKRLGMTYGDYMEKISQVARDSIDEQTRGFVHHAHEAFREKDAYLLSEMILLDGNIGPERCYKRAMKGDERYVFKDATRRVRLKGRADDRFDKMLDNAEKQKLLSEDEIKKFKGPGD